ncbi:MAG: hypothetical protein AB1758_04725 [Candidatus Eremiobacterota bacterium]
METRSSSVFSESMVGRLRADHPGRAILTLRDPRVRELYRHYLLGEGLKNTPEAVLGPGWRCLPGGTMEARFGLDGSSEQELCFLFSFDRQGIRLVAVYGPVTEELREEPDREPTWTRREA